MPSVQRVNLRRASRLSHKIPSKMDQASDDEWGSANSSNDKPGRSNRGRPQREHRQGGCEDSKAHQFAFLHS